MGIFSKKPEPKKSPKIVDILKQPLATNQLYEYAHELCFWNGAPLQTDEVGREYLEIQFNEGPRKLYGEAINYLSPRTPEKETESCAQRRDFIQRYFHNNKANLSSQKPGVF